MKKLWSTARLGAIVLGFAFVLGIGLKAEAAGAPGQVAGLKQTDAGSSSVEIVFQALLDNEAEYEIQLSSAPAGNYKEWRTCSSGKCSLYNLPNAGSSYYLRVVSYYENSETNWEKVYGTPSAPIEVVTAPNGSVENLKHTNSTATSISLSWSPVAGANSYQVKYSSAGGGDTVVYAAGTQAVLDKLAKGTEYTVHVYPARKSGTGFYAVGGGYDSKYNVPVIPGKAPKPSCEYYWQNLGEIRGDVDSVQCADGYEWEIWTAYQKKDKKVKSVSQSSRAAFIKYKGFKKYNFFKMRVRAYCTNDDGKMMPGQWSDWEHFCPQPEIIRLKSVKSGISLKWSTVKGADRYEVYASAKEKSGFKKCASTKKTSLTVKKFGKSSFKNKKTYYFYVEAYNKAGKKMYSGLAGNATDRWKIKYVK